MREGLNRKSQRSIAMSEFELEVRGDSFIQVPDNSDGNEGFYVHIFYNSMYIRCRGKHDRSSMHAAPEATRIDVGCLQIDDWSRPSAIFRGNAPQLAP